MSSRKRISVALAGLILLVLIGWFARERTAGGQDHPHAAAAPAAAAPVVAAPDVVAPAIATGHPLVDVLG